MMPELSFKEFHASSFNRYTLRESVEEELEQYLNSPITELLEAQTIFWQQRLPQLVEQYAKQHVAYAYKITSITLEPAKLTPEQCRQEKRTYTSDLKLEVQVASYKQNFILTTELLSLTPIGTFIKFGNDYAFINRLTKRPATINQEDGQAPTASESKKNSLKTKYVATLFVILEQAFTKFLEYFYEENRQKRWKASFDKKQASASTAQEPLFEPQSFLAGQLERALKKLKLNKTIQQRLELLKPVNPLDELSCHNTVKAWANKRASFEFRDISHDQYGRLCPIETPEGEQCGLVQHLSSYARFGKVAPEQSASRLSQPGEITVPYRKQKKGSLKGEIEFLTTEEETACYIAAYPTYNKAAAEAKKKSAWLRKGDTFLKAAKAYTTHVDISPGVFLSHSASLIPFLEHDDGHRALMAASMQKQALPLLHPEPPIIGTGREHFIAQQARYYQRPRTTEANAAESAAVTQGELALGSNILVAYMPWHGFTHEDAIVISDELVDKDILTSIHEYTYVLELEQEERLSAEYLKPSTPNRKTIEDTLIVTPGTRLSYGDALICKIKNVADTLSPLSIFNEKVYRDASLYLTDFPYAENFQVREVVKLDNLKHPTEEPEEIKTISITISYQSKIKVGDKLAGRHGNKGVVSLIVPKEYMPYYYNVNNEKVHIQMLLDPLGVPSRMNLGQLYEVHLGRLALYLGELIKAGKLTYDYADFLQHLPDEPVPKHSGHLGPAVFFAIPPFCSPSIKDIQQLYKELDLPEHCKRQLHYKKDKEDPETLDVNEKDYEYLEYPDPITVGVAYMMKLDHQVEEKIHVRSTGKYSKIFQQPAKGRQNKGGQRLGEMELWALEAYGASHNIQECLTYKSDDLAGRDKIEAALKDNGSAPSPNIPLAFDIMREYIKAMGLNLRVNTTKTKEATTDLKSEVKKS